MMVRAEDEVMRWNQSFRLTSEERKLQVETQTRTFVREKIQQVSSGNQNQGKWARTIKQTHTPSTFFGPADFRRRSLFLQYFSHFSLQQLPLPSFDYHQSNHHDGETDRLRLHIGRSCTSEECAGFCAPTRTFVSLANVDIDSQTKIPRSIPLFDGNCC